MEKHVKSVLKGSSLAETVLKFDNVCTDLDTLKREKVQLSRAIKMELFDRQLDECLQIDWKKLRQALGQL